VLAAAGTVGLAGGATQFIGGMLQGMGGTDYENAEDALITTGLGWVLGKAITGRPKAPSSRSQERTQKFLNRTAATTGGVWDLASWFAPDLAPQLRSCAPR